MHRYLLLFALLISTALHSTAQDFKTQYSELNEKNDTIGEVALLKKWEAAKPTDPHLFIAYFNFYVNKSRDEYISIQKKQKEETDFQISDSTGKTVGYLGSTVRYNPVYLSKGFSYIDKAIQLYPDRLDLRFGKIYMLGECENYDEFTTQIVAAIEHGVKIKSRWHWLDDSVLQDGKTYFLTAIQDYIGTLYNAGDGHFTSIRSIAETVLKYYPDNVENLSNIAITYLVNSEYDKALVYLTKAEKIAPNDPIVLNNIAEAYKRKKDNVNATIYYNKVIKVGNEEEIKDAKEKLEDLKKN